MPLQSLPLTLLPDSVLLLCWLFRYESVIRKVGDGQVFVHFKGWQDKWDEKRPFNDKRLAPRSLYTTGARDAAASRQQSRDGLKYNTQGKPMEKGVVGLRNLGNT